MGYRIVRVEPEVIFENFFKEYASKYEEETEREYEELFKITDGLPKDAEFVGFRMSSANSDLIKVVFESDEWSEKDNFDVVDVGFKSYTLEKSEVEELLEV